MQSRKRYPAKRAILLVGVSHDEWAMYALHLRHCDLQPAAADTTDAALNGAADADVIVTEIELPGSFDALELIRRLRLDTRTKSKPVIVLTAWTSAADRVAALAAGCDVFLTKPCVPSVLTQHVSRLTRTRSLQKERCHEVTNCHPDDHCPYGRRKLRLRSRRTGPHE